MDGSLVPRHGGWLLEWRSSGQEEAPQVGSGAGSCKEVGSGAYIVGVVGHPYLATLLPLWLTMSSYPSTTPAVLAVGRTTAGAPILASDQLPRLVGHVDGPVVRGREDVAARSLFAISDT
ncbi:hypothetical protein B296_00013576 [Ensete ventricosum]|uniref:Uncharacterized protein n=1 Tax=Ensete ventricosum TaxID=4639 RepID=A0A427B0J1_ENSVE|nr:hypothetical protein B296_00013576 [Ensete ventricosum]